MPTFAAIDIGSNSCRLKISKVVAHQLETVIEEREVTRLGASVFECGQISPDAMAVTIAALKRFQRTVQEHGVDRIRVVATSAMRDARNGMVFQAMVKAETGWNMEIISGLEEGRLIHLGVTASVAGETGGRALLFDLGGGSCEITLSEDKHILETVSLPLGAVRLTQEFLAGDPAPADGLARMQQFIARELRPAHSKIQLGDVSSVIATSGTAAALSDVFAAQMQANNKPETKSEKKSAGKTNRKTIAKTQQSLEVSQAILSEQEAGLVPTAAVRHVAEMLAPMTLTERVAVKGIGPKRAEIIVAGAGGCTGRPRHQADSGGRRGRAAFFQRAHPAHDRRPLAAA